MLNTNRRYVKDKSIKMAKKVEKFMDYQTVGSTQACRLYLDEIHLFWTLKRNNQNISRVEIWHFRSPEKNVLSNVVGMEKTVRKKRKSYDNIESANLKSTESMDALVYQKLKFSDIFHKNTARIQMWWVTHCLQRQFIIDDDGDKRNDRLFLVFLCRFPLLKLHARSRFSIESFFFCRFLYILHTTSW